METTNTGRESMGVERRSTSPSDPAESQGPRRRLRLQRPTLRGTTNVGTLERVLSVLGGSALAAYGLRRRGAPGTLAALAGAVLVERGATGHCMVYQSLGLQGSAGSGQGLVRQHGRGAVLEAAHAIRVEHSVTVNRPRPELFRYWRALENLPSIMRHVESVTVLDDRRSRWRAKAPAGQSVEWTAVIHNEVENELIAWKSLDDAAVPNAGSVHFTDTGDGRGTEVRVLLKYDPPAGRLGQAVARLFGEEPGIQVREDLRRFKESMESGAESTGSGRPAAAT